MGGKEVMGMLAQANSIHIPLADKSVHCVVTSPPYWSLRDYGLPPTEWPTVTYTPMPGLEPVTVQGCEEGCEHEWTEAPPKRNRWGLDVGASDKQVSNRGNAWEISQGSWCSRCGGWRGNLGLESTPEAYVAHIVAIFREVWRVLRDDGTIFLNLGDSYTSGMFVHGYRRNVIQPQNNWAGTCLESRKTKLGSTVQPRSTSSLKPKDLCGIPWRVAFALQADGWYLRSDVIFAKMNPMPECLSPDTHIFVKVQGKAKRITLGELSGLRDYPLILTPNGWRKIIHVWEVEKEYSVQFEAAKVCGVECSEDHRWPISHDRRRDAIHLTKTAEIRDTGYWDYLLWRGLDGLIETTVVELAGRQLDYDLGWLIGLYAAEGGCNAPRGFRCKITLHIDEDTIAERSRRILEEKFQARVSERKNQQHHYRYLRFSNRAFHYLVGQLVPGKVSSKCLNLDIILNAPRQFRQGLWDGYIAGDGSCRQGHGSIVVSSSKDLRDSFALIGASLGIVTSKGRRKQEDARTGKTYVAYSLWTPYATRRQLKQGSQCKQILCRNKRIIKGPRRMIDLEVEDGLFLIEDGLVTHNSVKDRPTKAHEYLFLLAKQARYYYDADAVREPNTNGTRHRLASGPVQSSGDNPKNQIVGRWGGKKSYESLNGHNRRTVWMIPTQPYPGAHFATFAPALVQPCVLAGTSAKGVCPVCGKGWTKVMINETYRDKSGTRPMNKTSLNVIRAGWRNVDSLPQVVIAGWRPDCKCYGVDLLPDPPKKGKKTDEEHEREMAEWREQAQRLLPLYETLPTVPATVLDPFCGSGTTGYVCRTLPQPRRFIGLDLSWPYLHDQALVRSEFKTPKASLVELPLFAGIVKKE